MTDTPDYPDNRGPGRPSKYNLKTIPPGSSVFIPGAKTHSIHKSACDARKWTPGLTLRVKCRKVIKGGVEGIRVMRIE
jgi:hypothetical protein